MKIQISPVKKIEDALCIWSTPGPDVDMVLDITKPLPFRPDSIKHMYAFHALGETPFARAQALLNSWGALLKEKGHLYVIETNMEYIYRNMLTGDILLEEVNKQFIRQAYYNKDLLATMLIRAGFPVKEQRVWFEQGLKFQPKHYEIVISGEKKTSV
mgnify:CR=1 FL=1